MIENIVLCLTLIIYKLFWSFIHFNSLWKFFYRLSWSIEVRNYRSLSKSMFTCVDPSNKITGVTNMWVL